MTGPTTRTITLTLLGFLSTACGTSTQTLDEVNQGTINALTYNVAGLPEGISSSNPTEYIPQISPLLNAYDLVLVQEDFVYHRDLSRETTHPFQSEPKDPVERLMADGLNRFSHYAFEPLERQQWNECYGSFNGGNVSGAGDCMAEKGFSMARTTLAPGIIVDIYNHHAEAGGGEADVAARAAGFAQLTEFIQRHSAGHAVIVGGDTNLHRFDPADDPVLSAFESENNLTDACGFLDCGTESIDRFFFRNSDTVSFTPLSWRYAPEFVNDTGSDLSDHYAVNVEFLWERIQDGQKEE